MGTLECKFDIGQKVIIDGDRSLTGIVTCVEWRRPDVLRYEISWFANGSANFTIFDEWRLAAA